MGKEWPCKDCGVILTWKSPYDGSRPVEKDDIAKIHECNAQPSGKNPESPNDPNVTTPDLKSNQTVKDATPADIPKHLQTNPKGTDLENSYVNNRRALSLQVWHLAMHDANLLVGGNKDKQLEVAETLYLGMMSNL